MNSSSSQSEFSDNVKNQALEVLASHIAVKARVEEAYKRICPVLQESLAAYHDASNRSEHATEQPTPVHLMEVEMLASAEVLIDFYRSLYKSGNSGDPNFSVNAGITMGKLMAIKDLISELVSPSGVIKLVGIES